MNKIKDGFIKSIKELAEDLGLVGEEQEVFVKKASESLIKEFDLDFSDEEEKE